MKKTIKKIRVLVLVNTLQDVSSFIYSNHIAFFVWHAKHHPEIEFVFNTPHRTSIDHARNGAATMAMNADCDYLLFLDDDVLVPKDSLYRLIQADKDICAGLVIIRGYPYNVMAFKYDKKANKKDLGFYNNLPKDKDGKLKQLVPCDAVGFSLCLIKTEVLRNMSAPFFVTGTGLTEDVYFCLKAKDENEIYRANHDLTIFMDTSIRCGHILTPEPVEWNNRLELKKYYESLLPKETLTPEGRGRAYIEKNLKALGQ